MNGKIVSREETILLGLSFYGNPFSNYDGWEEENEIGCLWKRFMENLGKWDIRNRKNRGEMFELHLEDDKTRERGIYEVFVGVEVAPLERPPLHSLVKILPPSLFAVFTLKGEKVTTDWAKELYAKWLPDMGYKRSMPFGFNLYDHRFKGMDRLEESELDIYIPVSKL